jgi:hypothetical protein
MIDEGGRTCCGSTPELLNQAPVTAIKSHYFSLISAKYLLPFARPGVRRPSHSKAAMKGDKKVIQLLNEALRNEADRGQPILAALPDARRVGIHKLAEFERHESIDEMKHADRLAGGSCSSRPFPISRCSTS